MNQHTAIVVTDIATLDKLAHSTYSSTNYTLRTIKSLEIVLYVPKVIFTAIELQHTGQSAQSPTNEDTIDVATKGAAAAWLSLGLALHSLQSLRKIKVWLDHNSKSFWWRINESVILSPFSDLASRPDNELSVHLPSHADDDIPVPPFNIIRRPRQEKFGEIGQNGCLSVVSHMQFPIFALLRGLDDGEMSKDDEWERKLWKRGSDMERTLRELEDMYHIHVH